MEDRGVATKTSQRVVAEFAELVQCFAHDSNVTSGKMFGSVALKVNGKVFAMLVRSDLVVKLPKMRVEQLVASGAGKAFDPGHGKVMKEWVCVPVGGTPWLALAQEARRFVIEGHPG
jgi:TfoX/Sxy family transcriptional regulator of competence genes